MTAQCICKRDSFVGYYDYYFFYLYIYIYIYIYYIIILNLIVLSTPCHPLCHGEMIFKNTTPVENQYPKAATHPALALGATV